MFNWFPENVLMSRNNYLSIPYYTRSGFIDGYLPKMIGINDRIRFLRSHFLGFLIYCKGYVETILPKEEVSHFPG